MSLILADGTTIDGGQAGYSQGFLWCYFYGYTMQQAAMIFFDENKTSRIEFHYGEMVDVYDDFTNCINLNIDVEGKISACLKKGAA